MPMPATRMMADTIITATTAPTVTILPMPGPVSTRHVSATMNVLVSSMPICTQKNYTELASIYSANVLLPPFTSGSLKGSGVHAPTGVSKVLAGGFSCMPLGNEGSVVTVPTPGTMQVGPVTVADPSAASRTMLNLQLIPTGPTVLVA